MPTDTAQMRYFKTSGGGNDFVAVLDASKLTPSTVRALCARGLSLGADGAFALTRLGSGEPATVRMDYFNGDGTKADLCVNGTRCAAQLAFHLGWADAAVVIETGAGRVSASALGGHDIDLRLPPPASPAKEQTVDEQMGWVIDTGVPHFVIDWPESLVAAPVWERGPALRQASAFAPAGSNIDYVRFVGSHRIEIRTYERGVEAETLACGTGVLAAAAVGVQLGRSKLPITALTSGGFEMTVSGALASNGSIKEWSLAADARILGEGTLLPGAFEIPEPPLWNP